MSPFPPRRRRSIVLVVVLCKQEVFQDIFLIAFILPRVEQTWNWFWRGAIVEPIFCLHFGVFFLLFFFIGCGDFGVFFAVFLIGCGDFGVFFAVFFIGCGDFGVFFAVFFIECGDFGVFFVVFLSDVVEIVILSN